MAKETILVADDDRVALELLSLWLHAHGFAVTKAADGMQVIMSVRKTPPSAILLNLTMPGGTGFDVLQRLGANAAMRGIPVIAMSASVDPELPRKALASGAKAFLYKPVEQNEVVATVRGVLAQATRSPQDNP
jgi:CheY-like chemotaxis protein